MGMQGDHYPYKNVDVPLVQSLFIKDMIGLGVGNVRTDMFFHWGEVERTKGKYDAANEGGMQERFVSQLVISGIRPMLILSYGNPLYEECKGAFPIFCAPASEEAIRAFGEYCYQMTSFYRGKVAYWEIWNEPNVGFGYEPPSPQLYMALVREASRRIRQADPGAFIVAGGANAISKTYQLQHPTWYTAEMWYKQCFALGLAGLVDAIGVHYYRGTPEEGEEVISYLKTLLSQYKAQNIQIWDTEDGYDARQIGEVPKAKNLARLFLNNYGLGIGKTFWYAMEWNDPRSSRELLGLFDGARNPLASASAYRAVSQVLGECPENITDKFHGSFEAQLPVYAGLIRDRLRHYVFRTRRAPRRNLLAVWLTLSPQQTYPGIPIRARTASGRVLPLRVLDSLSGQWSSLAEARAKWGLKKGELVVPDYPLIYEIE
jgi:hypothetical protein